MHKGHKFFSSKFHRRNFHPRRYFEKKKHKWNFQKWSKIDIWHEKMRFFSGIACYICHMVWKPLKWPKGNFPHLQNIKIPKNHREIQNWKFMFLRFFSLPFLEGKSQVSKNVKNFKKCFFQNSKYRSLWSRIMICVSKRVFIVIFWTTKAFKTRGVVFGRVWNFDF